MDGIESKKLALIRIYQILKDETDCDHRLTQEEIASRLDSEYGIVIERKAIGRNLSLLKEAGFDVDSDKKGSCLRERIFEDSELRLLIDSVLASKHIAVKHSKDLIKKLSSLSNKYFRRHVRNVYSVNEWDKTENKTLFLNIDLIDEAIENGKMIEYDYNKYGPDKALHKSSHQKTSPYQLVLHNQRYYLMGRNEKWGDVAFYRVDRMTGTKVTDYPITPLRSVAGYENGIDYRRISSSMPYMYNDAPERVTFTADAKIMDQIVDWFGKDILVEDKGDKVTVTLSVSPTAMVYWALQYADNVTVLSPDTVRDRIKAILNEATENYK